jgi:NADP-dependent 3-hydroxy acid dehydrogenase YdfG
VSVVVLIGATSGLGRRAADQLAADGHRLFLVGRDSDRAAELSKRLPQATVITADMSVRAGVEQAVAEIAAGTERIDVLVNNAGVMTPARARHVWAATEELRPHVAAFPHRGR